MFGGREGEGAYNNEMKIEVRPCVSSLVTADRSIRRIQTSWPVKCSEHLNSNGTWNPTPPSNSQVPAGCPTTRLSLDTIYTEIASDPTC